MLSEREARALRLIEQQLTADDPRFTTRMSRALPDRPSRWPQKLQISVITVTLLSAVVCLAVGEVSAGLATALFAGALIWARRFLDCGAVPLRRRGWWRGFD